MKFEMWSMLHYLYILSPAIIITILFFVLRNRSEKTKYIVGAILGSISLLVLLIRNIDIANNMTSFSGEIIPLQVCHFGNIMGFIALVFRSKIAGCVLWNLNLIGAFASLVVADSLANYGSFWEIRAQAYFWGHLLIVLCALYMVVFKIVKFDKKSFLISLGALAVTLIPVFILNPYFRNILGQGINYFYIFDSKGIPFEFLYNDAFTLTYGWFEINVVYSISLIVIGIAVMTGFYYLEKLRYRKDKTYTTHNMIYQLKHRKKIWEN